jgi:bacillithiol biosynthesis deacetylase BshB1
MSSQIDILAFGAHPDDVELSAGGTLLRHRALGKTIGIVDLTEGELGTRGTVETRYAEAKKAAEILGLTLRTNLQLADGFFQHNESSLMKVIEVIRAYRPKIVLTNAITDRHPDHGRAAKLVSEACFLSGLSKIKSSYNGINQEAHRPNAVYHYIQDRFQKPDFVVDISPYVDQKLAAIAAFQTQFWNPESIEPSTPISSKEFINYITASMQVHGRSIGVAYAEGFNVERQIGVSNLFDLT